MKIGNNPSTATPAPSTTDRSSRSASSAPAGPAAGTASAASTSASSTESAQVDLSPTASMLSAAGADPTFDSAKVAKIAQAIKDGKFTVNAHSIADKLISNAQELLGRSGSH